MRRKRLDAFVLARDRRCARIAEATPRGPRAEQPIQPTISLALRDLLSRVSRNLGFFRASKHGVSGYSVPLPGGSRVIVETREERTAPLLAALQIIFARQLRRRHQRAQTETGGQREPLRITKRAVLDVAKNGNGRPIDSESQRQLGWRGSMKFADEGRAGSAHEKRV